MASDKGQFCNKCDQSTVLEDQASESQRQQDKKIVAVAVEIAVVTVTMSEDEQTTGC